MNCKSERTNIAEAREINTSATKKEKKKTSATVKTEVHLLLRLKAFLKTELACTS
jgi:hypothetical protein